MKAVMNRMVKQIEISAEKIGLNQESIIFTRLDTQLARFLVQRSQLSAQDNEQLETWVRLLSYAVNNGHSCIHIDESTAELLLASGLASEQARTPLIINDDRLYLRRYWRYEQQLVELVRGLVVEDAVLPGWEAALDNYFDPVAAGETDWQKAAASLALRHRFAIITGGPGTGKTTTVVKILALLQQLTEQPLHVALAAPTGKAAMRLQESIGNNRSQLPCSNEIKNSIPTAVTTLHRLLGAQPPSPFFRHNADYPLPHDVVVVDEVSMVDLALMSKLLAALKPGARLILLGDQYQLASVESGVVLADLTAVLPEYTVELEKSYRFDRHIKDLAEAVKQQNSKQAWSILNSNEHPNVGLLETDLIQYIVEKQAAYLQQLQSGAGFKQVYQQFIQFQVLCSNRLGDRGVESVNSQVEQKLIEQNLIPRSGRWYPGRPIMVMQNDAGKQLYNGDIGLCMADTEAGGQLRVFFEQADASVKKYLPARLPRSETVFAMTIHKSQGSEFDEVLVLLPDNMNPVLTRELLYTGITRAKSVVQLVLSQSVLQQTVERKVERLSGVVESYEGV